MSEKIKDRVQKFIDKEGLNQGTGPVTVMTTDQLKTPHAEDHIHKHHRSLTTTLASVAWRLAGTTQPPHEIKDYIDSQGTNIVVEQTLRAWAYGWLVGAKSYEYRFAAHNMKDALFDDTRLQAAATTKCFDLVNDLDTVAVFKQMAEGFHRVMFDQARDMGITSRPMVSLKIWEIVGMSIATVIYDVGYEMGTDDRVNREFAKITTEESEEDEI